MTKSAEKAYVFDLFFCFDFALIFYLIFKDMRNLVFLFFVNRTVKPDFKIGLN